MSAKGKVLSKEVAINASNGRSDTDVVSMRHRLEEHEIRHLKIKTEFESLKQLNEEMSERHDKDVKELKFELRSAQRDVDKHKETIKFLREDRKEMKDELTATKTAVDGLKQSLIDKDKQIEQLMAELKTLSSDLNGYQSDQKSLQDSHQNRVKILTDETKALREKLKKELIWREKYEKSEQSLKEFQKLQKEMDVIQKELVSKTNDIANKDKRIKKLESTAKVLQDQCKAMDNQAEQFKNKYVGLGAQKEKLLADKDCTVSQVHRLQREKEKVERQLESVLKDKDECAQRLDAQRIQFENMVDIERQKFLSLKYDFEVERQKNREFEERISIQGQNIYTNDETIVSLEAKVTHLKNQLIAIKEEAAKHITTIGDMTEANNKMTIAFQESIERSEDLQQRIESLHHELELKDDEMIREKIASQDTIGQHLKLIDFLQSKLQTLEKQKKPLFSITPTKKFVDYSPRTHCPIELKDLDRLLAEERTKNRRLVEELSKLKVDTNYYKNEVFQLKKSIKTDETNQRTQSAEAFRKPLSLNNNTKASKRRDTPFRTPCPPSSQRMHHNIPHRFTEMTNKIPNNRCVLCSEAIHFGRKAAKCSECNAVTHRDCAQCLPNNCGLPDLMMRTLFHSTNDVNDDIQLNDYYQSQPVDDVIEIEPLEPTAPEETFTKYDDNSDSSATTDNNESDSGAVMSNKMANPRDADLQEIEEILKNKENDSVNGFSFTDSMIEAIESEYKY